MSAGSHHLIYINLALKSFLTDVSSPSLNVTYTVVCLSPHGLTVGFVCWSNERQKKG